MLLFRFTLLVGQLPQCAAGPQSFSELPTQEDVDARQETLSTEYTEQAKRAKERGEQKLQEGGNLGQTRSAV